MFTRRSHTLHLTHPSLQGLVPSPYLAGAFEIQHRTNTARSAPLSSFCAPPSLLTCESAATRIRIYVCVRQLHHCSRRGRQAGQARLLLNGGVGIAGERGTGYRVQGTGSALLVSVPGGNAEFSTGHVVANLNPNPAPDPNPDPNHNPHPGERPGRRFGVFDRPRGGSTRRKVRGCHHGHLVRARGIDMYAYMYGWMSPWAPRTRMHVWYMYAYMYGWMSPWAPRTRQRLNARIHIHPSIHTCAIHACVLAAPVVRGAIAWIHACMNAHAYACMHPYMHVGSPHRSSAERSR